MALPWMCRRFSLEKQKWQCAPSGVRVMLTIEADGHRLPRAEVECVADVRGDDNAPELVDFSLHDVYNSFFVDWKYLYIKSKSKIVYC